ncbi:carbon starvation CstA family protein [Nonomuraea ferruginea]
MGFVITPQELQAAAAAVQEETLIARTGGAPTLAVGISEIFSGFLGGAALKAFWYHFAIMFEALFILTTVDAGTRVGRFMLQDTLGNVWKPMRKVSWWPGLLATSAIVVGGPGATSSTRASTIRWAASTSSSRCSASPTSCSRRWRSPSPPRC